MDRLRRAHRLIQPVRKLWTYSLDLHDDKQKGVSSLAGRSMERLSSFGDPSLTL